MVQGAQGARDSHTQQGAQHSRFHLDSCASQQTAVRNAQSYPPNRRPQSLTGMTTTTPGARGAARQGAVACKAIAFGFRRWYTQDTVRLNFGRHIQTSDARCAPVIGNLTGETRDRAQSGK